jgi:Tfp pilus assembly protein PilO
MMNLGIKTIDRICVVLAISVSLACGYWVINQAIKKQKQVRQENEILSQGIVELESAEVNFEHFNKLLLDTKEQLESLDKIVPEVVNIGEVLTEIDLLMKQRQITLLSLQPQPKVEEEIYAKIPVRLRFKGSFVDIYHFLYDLETMDRMLVAENMNITRNNLDEKCQAELTASVYQRQME